MSERPLDFDAGEDAPAPEPRPPAPPPPGPARRPAGRMGWLIGVIVLATLAWITFNTLRSDSPGSRGLPDNLPLPPAAMPLATGDLPGDANTARTPDSGGAGRLPACDVRGPEILNICQLAERGPLVLAFTITKSGGRCVRQLDGIERVRRRFPGVQFAGVGIKGDRGSLRKLIAQRGWGFPVGYDHDGGVANVYAVAVCPTLTFAYPGGIVMHTAVGLESDAELATRVRRLVAASKARGWTPPS